MYNETKDMEINTRTYSLSIERYLDGYLAYFPALEGYNTWGKTYKEGIKLDASIKRLCSVDLDG